MSSLNQRLTSLVSSLFHSLEANTQTKVRILAAACGMLATIGMWWVHLSYPYLFYTLLQTRSRAKLLVAFALVLAPPFAVAFSIGSLIWPHANEPVNQESGPMSGYFYRERADRKWKIIIGAGIIAAVNFMFMLATSHSP